ncbi:glucose/arabinose dehydrogenase [Flavobacterium sp. 270]|uniref:PQQ-dependent sugar dehydrogenase n=1 Tax=Flavobacterium sp. 270 TaxID=2512114 RepID=UPI001064A450|nr:PQQ-dependent sugar dehydrogenase [Flavobacterium sp. 270]TDW48156.1 glucose/arabinose dehydrogenase [Flavobacterium sp. 270]
MRKSDRIPLFIVVFAVIVSFIGIIKSDYSIHNYNYELTLPQGFRAEQLIDSLGKVRHITVTQDGKIYARLAKPIDGHGTLLLEQKNGKATVVLAFGNYGGTGVRLYKGYLYTSSNSEIFRYKLDKNEKVIDTNARETIVTGLLDNGTHETKSIMMDNAGNMYIPIGCPLNSCQQEDRKKGSMGIPDCPLLKISGGVWKFKPNVKNQTIEDGERFATGLRNVVAVDWNTETNQLYVMQHGRDQLDYLFPDLYTIKQNAEIPAECMYALKKGDNAGWPFIYYDYIKKKKIVMPEYGGDGKMEGSSKYLNPVAAYPAHMAPNDILFYTGNQFPKRYKNGAFIAFHGSWNRRPEPQAGYFVVFQSFKNGKPFGDWEVFADGFSGSPENTESGHAERRPCGLAQGPDGSLYISDDKKGAIYKISYNENMVGEEIPQPKKIIAVKTVVKETNIVSDKIKKSYTNGATIYANNCAVCHMDDGAGVSNLNAPLKKSSHVIGEKSRLIKTLLDGLKGGKLDGETYSNVMPSHSFLTDKEIADVLTYVRNSFGNKASAVDQSEIGLIRKK